MTAAVVSVDLDLGSSLTCGPKQDGGPTQLRASRSPCIQVVISAAPSSVRQRRNEEAEGMLREIRREEEKGRNSPLDNRVGSSSLKMLTMEERRKQRYQRSCSVEVAVRTDDDSALSRGGGGASEEGAAGTATFLFAATLFLPVYLLLLLLLLLRPLGGRNTSVQSGGRLGGIEAVGRPSCPTNGSFGSSVRSSSLTRSAASAARRRNLARALRPFRPRFLGSPSSSHPPGFGASASGFASTGTNETGLQAQMVDSKNPRQMQSFQVQMQSNATFVKGG